MIVNSTLYHMIVLFCFDVLWIHFGTLLFGNVCCRFLGPYMQRIRDRYMKEMEERSGRAMMEKAAEAAMLEEALSKC